MTPRESSHDEPSRRSTGVTDRGIAVDSRCPLCHATSLTLHHTAIRAIPWKLYDPQCSGRAELNFFRCMVCDLIVKDPRVRATREQEREHYAKHNNDICDAGYRRHLLRLVEPVLKHAPQGAIGLDFGCGPSITIAALAREQGIECRSYDPHFFPDADLLREGAFDFITCSEVVEHFKDPRAEFRLLSALLKPQGVLGVMTHLVPDEFAEWWYHRDPTHVAFYSLRTFDWIATNLGLSLLECLDGVVLFAKPAGASVTSAL